MEFLTVSEELAQLVAELNPEEQMVMVELLRLLIDNRVGKKHSITELGELSEEESAHTLWAMGIDAQDYVNELRGKREPEDALEGEGLAAPEYAGERRGQR